MSPVAVADTEARSGRRAVLLALSDCGVAAACVVAARLRAGEGAPRIDGEACAATVAVLTGNIDRGTISETPTLAAALRRFCSEDPTCGVGAQHAESLH